MKNLMTIAVLLKFLFGTPVGLLLVILFCIGMYSSGWLLDVISFICVIIILGFLVWLFVESFMKW